MTWMHEHAWKLDASTARVFAALTRKDELERWFAEHADVSLVPEGRYRFWGRYTLGVPDGAGATQVINRLDPDRSLGFTWSLYGVPTTVSMALAAEGDATRLTLHHQVEGVLPVPRARELIDDHWRLAFGNLAAHLAGGAGVVLPDYADPAPEVRLVISIAAPREAVFRALIEPDIVNKWFGAESAVVEPEVGGRYELGWKYQVDGRDVLGGPTRILDMVPNEKLVLDWPDWRGDQSVTGQKITFYLEPEGSGTKVTFVHSGFDRTADMSDYPFGWVGFMDNLAGLFR